MSHSPKGWTDQELGLRWLQKDFKPQTAAWNHSNGYCLLILDGHNSHGTYEFCKFATDHNIIILCLPSHTTYTLQPLDVGVFGPLASAWKKQVNEAYCQFIAIKKHNLLEYYKKAHDKAMSPSTIQSAFAKTGIYPLNPDVIEDSAYEPALNTTTQPAPPINSALHSFLFLASTNGSTNAPSLPQTSAVASFDQLPQSSTIIADPLAPITVDTLSNIPHYPAPTNLELIGIPPVLCWNAPLAAIQDQNTY